MDQFLAFALQYCSHVDSLSFPLILDGFRPIHHSRTSIRCGGTTSGHLAAIGLWEPVEVDVVDLHESCTVQ